jgi:hypothetical protein
MSEWRLRELWQKARWAIDEQSACPMCHAPSGETWPLHEDDCAVDQLLQALDVFLSDRVEPQVVQREGTSALRELYADSRFQRQWQALKLSSYRQMTREQLARLILRQAAEKL